MYYNENIRKMLEVLRDKMKAEKKENLYSTKTAFYVMQDALKTHPLFAEDARCLDYAIHTGNDTLDGINLQEAMPSIRITAGGSEGVYLSWGVADAHTRVKLGTLKTLDEGFSAYAEMGAIAGMLTYITEQYLYELQDMQ